MLFYRRFRSYGFWEGLKNLSITCLVAQPFIFIDLRHSAASRTSPNMINGGIYQYPVSPVNAPGEADNQEL
jgi:hypothetical protein